MSDSARKSRPGARAPLDRRRIAQTALQLIDHHGLARLSMRQLGSALGVEGMALYHHFHGKGELLDAVLELLLEEMEPAIGPEPPIERLRQTFEACRQVAIRHPHAFLLLPTRRFNTEAALNYYERLLGLFREVGCDAEQSARFFRVLAGFVTGASLAEIGSRAKQPDATPIRLEDFSDPERYPLVSAVALHLQVERLDAIFGFGMDLIFAALREQTSPT
ncbi:MAG: TetR/AcrR family transcriptional regulator C-terminal domain-containing protein [Pseudomonadota bacterium]